MPSTPRKTTLNELRRRLRDMFALQEAGAGHELARARGAVDGYMAALVDCGAAAEPMLLELVGDERRRWRGPGFALFTRADGSESGLATRARGTLASA
jgi:hypothetical protein